MFSTWLLSVLNPDRLLLPEQTERKGTEVIISFSVSKKSLEIPLSSRENSLQDNSLYSFSVPKTEIDSISSESSKTHTHTHQFCKGFLSPSKNDL